MKNLLALAAFLVIVIGGVGWYRGWFEVKKTPVDDGRSQVIIDVNSQQIKKDLNDGREKLKNILDKDGKPTSTTNPTNDPLVLPPIAPPLPPGYNPSSSFPQPPNVPQPPSGQQTSQNTVEPNNDGNLFVLPAVVPPTPAQGSASPTKAAAPGHDSWFFPSSK